MKEIIFSQNADKTVWMRHNAIKAKFDKSEKYPFVWVSEPSSPLDITDLIFHFLSCFALFYFI